MSNIVYIKIYAKISLLININNKILLKCKIVNL